MSFNDIAVLIYIGCFFQHGHHINIQLLFLIHTISIPTLTKYDTWTVSTIFRQHRTFFALSFLRCWLFVELMSLRNHFNLTVIISYMQRTLRFLCWFSFLQLFGITGTDKFIYLSRRKLETNWFLFLLGINWSINFIRVIGPIILGFWRK